MVCIVRVGKALSDAKQNDHSKWSLAGAKSPLKLVSMKKISQYLKMRVLGAVEVAEGRTIRQRIRKVSELTFTDEEGQRHRFTWRTIETWRCRYNKHGHAVLGNRVRSDKGKIRKSSPEEVLEAIEQAKPFMRPEFKLSELYRVCIEKGLLRRDLIAPNTFRRVVKAHEMLKPDSEVTGKKRLAFAKAHANQMWQGDTMFGPYLRENEGKAKQAKLIAFIDDASRVICHGQFVFHETHHAVKTVLRTAFYKRGIPDSLYLDNGSVYCSKDLTLICARLGCLICHTPVRDGAAKGKIERFFRTVRDQFLCRELDLSSLAKLNAQFCAWVEECYNHREHSTLGMKPVDRFGLDLKRIRYLPAGPYTEELFYNQTERTVIADNTFRHEGKRYEAPRDLRSRKIQIRFECDEAGTPTGNPVVYYKNERQGEARMIDFIANDRPSKKLLNHYQTTNQ